MDRSPEEDGGDKGIPSRGGGSTASFSLLRHLGVNVEASPLSWERETRGTGKA